MKYSNTVEYNIKTSLDSKGLTQLKSELQGLELKLQNMGNKGFLDEKTFVDARNQIQGLGQALTDAFNPSLGMLDLSKLNQELKNNDVTAQGLKTAFSSLGAEGQVAFNNLVGELGKLDTGILRTNSQIDKLFTTFSNTFRWGLVSSFFSQFMNAIHSSVDYVKELDDSLTQIMLVTDYNRDSMNEFAKSANEAAKAVSMTTTGMTNASLIFAQQGYDLGQSQELATLSAKVANASQQDTATTSDQITAYMNAYGLENNIAELTQAMDNWALIANVSAADVGELAQASQRAASMANAVGVSGEQLAAQIATIESVTREAPEQIGNGLKTLYARFSDISAGKEDEDGFGLGKVTSELNKIGVQVLNEMGQIRDVGDIMEDLMVIWDDLDQTSKVAAAQALAGKYQVNRFMALMDNSDMYQEYKGATGSAATGTLDTMNEEYAQSIEGRSARLQASLEGLFSTIFNTDDIYPWMDAAQGAVDLLQQFFDALGGGKTVLLGISSLLMQVFSKNMAQEINNAATNRAVQQQKLENLQNSQAALTTLGAANPNPNDANSQNILNFAQYMQANAKNFNAEQMNQANSILQELVQNSNAATMATDKLKESLSIIGTGITATTGEGILAPFLDSEGAVNATLLSEALQNMSQSEVADMFSHIQEDIKDAREGLLEFNKALQDYQQELRKTDSTDDSWNQSLNNLKATLLNLKDYIDPATYERYEQAVNEISQVTENAGDKTAETTAEVAKLADGLEKVAAKDLTNLDQLNKDAFQAKNTQMAAEDSNKVAGAFQEGMGSQAHIQEILNTFNAVQQLTFAWQAFQNLGSLWANEDLSTGEKVLQTIMNLTMAMPQLISAMQTLQGNSFLQNIGQSFMGIFEGETLIGGMEKQVTDVKNQVTEISQHWQSIQNIIKEGDLAKQTMQELAEKGEEIPEALRSIALTGDEARRHLSDFETGLQNVGKQGDEAVKGISTFSTTISGAMASAAAEGASGLGILAAGFKAAAAEAWAFITGPAAPFIIAGAAIAAIAVAIGQAQEQAKEAHDQAIADFEEAKNAQQQVADLSTKMDDWKSKRQSGGDNKELAEEADTLADSLRELGNEEEANAVHLAAIRAEANGTADSFNKLEDTLNTANQSMSDQSALATMEAANAVLKDRLSTTEEIAAANEAMQNAALDYNISQMSRTAGMDMGITSVDGDNDLRAATMDWQSLEGILDQSVPGFAEITDENEKLALALSHTSDEALRAAIQIEQLANANTNLTEGQQTSITQKLEGSGFSAQESLQLMASLDENASYQQIIQQIEEIRQQVDAGTPFEIALQAKMDPEQIRESVEASLAAYEPKDEDVDAADFQSLSGMFMDNADNMGEEGTPFADYSEDLLNNADALEEVVEGILRYDDAVQTLDKNLEDWRSALNDTNEFSKEHIDAVQDLQETYSDFLDLSEDMDVSEDFAANAENLELMKDAANGVEGAYEELAQAAAEDIIIHADVDDIDGAKEALSGLFDYLNSDAFSNLNIGDALDLSGIEDQINNLADATGWTADQMAAYLNSIGINIDPNMFEPINTALDNADANTAATANHIEGVVEGVADTVVDNLSYSTDTEMTAQTDTQNDQIMYTNLKPTPGPTTTIESTFPVGSANPTAGGSGAIETQTATAVVTGVTYQPQPVTESQVKQMTGYGLKSEVTKGGGGSGGVKLKKGATASKGSRGTAGAGKSSGGSRPSSGGGGGGGKSCFVAGTLISTSLGFRPIEQIQKGDIVLSYNKSFELNEYSKVLQTMIHDTIEPIYTLYIKDEQLRVTGIHRFLVTDKITCGIPQWVHAADLKVGQWVLFADGTWHVIHKIEVNIEHQIVYNFEVSGNHNYYVGRNQILAHNKGGGKGKKGGGGKAKTIEEKEKKKHEKDYYEEIDTQLEKVEKELSRIEKQQDKLVGDKARANQNKQLGLLQKQIELQKEHLRILTEEEKVDVTKRLEEQDKEAEKLIQKYDKLFFIPDPVYDEDGIIANYEQISQAIDDAHNKMIDEYNEAAKAGNEELTKEIQKDIDKLKEYGDTILKDAKKLNDITVEVEDLNNEIQELYDAMQDIRIEAFKSYEEARDGLKEIRESAAELNTIFRDFDPNSFVNSFSIDDTPYDDLIETMHKLDTIYNITREDAESFYDKLIRQKEADLAKTDDLEEQMAIQQSIDFFNSRKNNLSADNLNNGYLGVLSQDLTTLQEWMDNPESEDNIFGTDVAALTDTYKETYEALKEGFEEYRKLIQDYRDAVLDIYNEAEDAIDRQMDKYDNLVEKIERMSDTYALYYGEDSYAELDKFYAQQGDIMQNQLDQLTTAYEYWQEQYQRALETGDKKLIQEIEDKMNDAQDSMLEKAEELADLWVEKFENIVEANTQSIYDKLFNGKNFNELTDSWELQKDYMERYKDEVEKSYEIDKLRSKYLDLLNDAQGTSLQTQNKIRQQMQEQLKQLQDQTTVSEYDVKLANARLEILQKQIALEDAQRNKNQMQLRRDSQGNYRYTYRANQEDIKAAQDDLLDSEFDAYELTKNETISNNDRALNMIQDYLNKRADIFNKYKDDDEARTRALEQLSADYSKLLGAMEEDFKDTTNGMYDVLTFMVQNGTEDSTIAAAEMLDSLFESQGVFKDNTEVLWASMADSITDMLQKFEDTVEEANIEMIAQTEDLKNKMVGTNGVLTLIGSSADTMTDALNDAADATIRLTDETKNLYDLFGSDNTKLQEALSQIERYKQELQDTQDTTSSLAQTLRRANETIDTKTAEAQSYRTALDFAVGARQVQEGTRVKLKKGTFVHYDRYGGVQQDAEGNTGWRLPDDMWVQFDAPATEKNARYKYGFYATGDSLTSFGEKQPGDNENGRQNTEQRHHQKWWFNEDELQRNVLAAMDTGGYTGEWEHETPLYKNGKLALLHQKELVLNSSDTQNILSAVEIVRTIAAGINNRLTSISQNKGLFNFNSSMSSLGEEIQQRVEIKAEFPNVQDSYQIEQALLELSDQAYQYAHRNI